MKKTKHSKSLTELTGQHAGVVLFMEPINGDYVWGAICDWEKLSGFPCLVGHELKGDHEDVTKLEEGKGGGGVWDENFNTPADYNDGVVYDSFDKYWDDCFDKSIKIPKLFGINDSSIKFFEKEPVRVWFLRRGITSNNPVHVITTNIKEKT
jgi:hypothetical protein